MKEKSKDEILLHQRSSTVMIVDDEQKLLIAMKKYLMAKYYKIIICKSGTEAIEKLTKEKVDLLIIDILMNDMNGYEFVEHIKTNTNMGHIPFIFLTAKGMTEDRIKGYKKGCKAYLGKPFDPEELVAIVDNVLSDKKDIKSIINTKNGIKKLRNNIYNFDKSNKNTNFTKQEINILLSVSKGLTNKDIAHNLDVSVRNVENYITRLLNKTQLSNRVKLANYRHLFNNGE
jgi:DNA-binding NarL/FixJ family response regulator